MSAQFNEKDYSSKMDKTIQSLKKDISTLRTGRANSAMRQYKSGYLWSTNAD